MNDSKSNRWKRAERHSEKASNIDAIFSFALFRYRRGRSFFLFSLLLHRRAIVTIASLCMRVCI